MLLTILLAAACGGGGSGNGGNSPAGTEAGACSQQSTPYNPQRAPFPSTLPSIPTCKPGELIFTDGTISVELSGGTITMEEENGQVDGNFEGNEGQLGIEVGAFAYQPVNFFNVGPGGGDISVAMRGSTCAMHLPRGACSSVSGTVQTIVTSVDATFVAHGSISWSVDCEQAVWQAGCMATPN